MSWETDLMKSRLGMFFAVMPSLNAACVKKLMAFARQAPAS